MSNEKISTGVNARPRNETIAQTGAGLPDDTGRPVEVSDEEIARVRQKLMGEPGNGGSGGGAAGQNGGPTPANPDAVPADTPEAAENLCRRCAGTGTADDGPCPDCGGTGVVMTPVGGAG